jgi:hypothetical protein
MLMVCPQCKGSFDGVLQCPKCRVRLLLPGDKSVQTAEGPGPGKWHQTGPGRIIAGLVLGLGLSFGLLLLASVVMRVAKMELSFQASAVVFVGIQAFALLAGGMLAGAGQTKGIACGAAVGLVSGGLVLGGIISGMMASLIAPFTKDHPVQGLPPITPVTPEVIMTYGSFLTDIIFGALGGMLGVMIWKPLPKLDLPTSVPSDQKPILGTKLALPPQGDKKALFPWAGPIAWIRVLIGMGVAAVGGAIGTKPVMNFLLDFSGLDRAEIVKVQENVAQGELLALSVLIGGTIAGATTSNGLKQGVLVGIGAGIGMVGYFMSQGGAGAEKLLGPLMLCVFLGPLGGWFGSELMPPAAKEFRRRKKKGWF